MAEDQKLASASGALQNLFGTGDENVRLLEKLMDVHVALRGGDIVVEGGDEQRVDGTREILKKLCALAEKGRTRGYGGGAVRRQPAGKGRAGSAG